jgi:outer membrane receptor protein involved in Fe transport
MVAAAWMLAGPDHARAQGLAEGSIVGQVVDETKAVLPGVVVTATNPATGFTRQSVTDGEGTFRLVALPPADYEVVAELAGFGTFRNTVTVTVASDTRLAVGLRVAALDETITVSGEAPLVEVTRTEQSATISQREVEGLPTNDRNFLTFALLTPGVVRGRSGGAGFGGENGFSSSGNRGDQNGINIDGLSNKSLDNGHDAGGFSQEAIQEFNVVTQGYPAEFGGAAGGVLNAVSKSGTNQFDGYVYTFLRDDAFDRPLFEEAAGSDGVVSAVTTDQTPEFRRFIGGVTIGWPIKRDRLFFFGLVEATRSNTPRQQTIRQETIDAVNTIVGPVYGDNQFNAIRQFKPRDNQGSAKVDWTVSPAHNATFRGVYTNRFSPPGIPNGRNSVSGSNETWGHSYIISGSLNSFLSDRTLNTMRFQTNRDDGYVDFPALGGRQNIRNFPARLQIGGGTGGNFGRGNGGGGEHGYEAKWEANDTLTMYRDNHTFKVGGVYTFSQFFQTNNYGPDGVWEFSNLNAFIAGRPTAFFQTYGHGATYMKTHYVSVFAQDQWQPTPALTIDYGIRYQYDRHPTDFVSYQLPESTFNPSTLERTTDAGAPGMGGFQNDANNVMPRLGVAYTPDGGRTVLKGAGGAFYGMQYLGELANPLGWNGPPNSYRFTFNSVEAAEIWAGTVDPASPYYNPLGIRRLPYYYYDEVLVPEGIPPTNNSFRTNLETPMSWQANVGVDRQLTGNIAVSGSFLYSRGYNNIRNVNVNPRAPIFHPAGSLLPNGVVTPFDVQYRGGDRPDPSFTEHWQYGNFGKVSFKGISTSISGRWANLQTRVSYSWNDSWDDSVAISFRQGPSNPDCIPCEWSRAVINAQRVVGSIVYQTPQTWNPLARDWQLSSILEYESGHPYQMLAGFDFNNDTLPADRPLGVPRNSLITDAYKNVDLRITRTFGIRDDLRLEVLFEMFNVLNLVNWTSYVDQLYVFQGGRYVARPDFAAFANGADLNALDTHRAPDDIGLDPRIRRSGIGEPMQGQLGFRFRF